MNLKAYYDGRKEARLKKQGIKLPGKTTNTSKLTPQQEILQGIRKWLSDKASITAKSEQGSTYWKFYEYPSILRLSDHLPNYFNVLKRVFTDKRTYADVTHFMSVVSSKDTEDKSGGKGWLTIKDFEKAIEESNRRYIFTSEYVIQPGDTVESAIEVISKKLMSYKS